MFKFNPLEQLKGLLDRFPSNTPSGDLEVWRKTYLSRELREIRENPPSPKELLRAALELEGDDKIIEFKPRSKEKE